MTLPTRGLERKANVFDFRLDEREEGLREVGEGAAGSNGQRVRSTFSR